MAAGRRPIATYRIQFSPRFGFGDARALVPYLHDLGISDLYASPILQARRGSAHGYDVTDVLSLNRELGTEEGFEALTNELRRYGMGLLLDIVPNHMAASPENLWWMDVLENGRSSRHAPYFDIHWDFAGGDRGKAGRIVLPMLRNRYREALTRGQFILSFVKGSFVIEYRGLQLPLDPRSYAAILSHGLPTTKSEHGRRHAWAQQVALLVRDLEQLPPQAAVEAGDIEERYQRKESLKQELYSLYCSCPEVRDHIKRSIDTFNGARGMPDSFHHMDQLLANQAYRLEHWRSASKRLSYRRFFDISDLIGIRVEDPQVFEAVHPLVLQAAGQQKVTGLRIDHIDGLYDPLEYLLRLRSHLAAPGSGREGTGGFYVIVEKILTGDERLPDEWPVCGTTGYEFLNASNDVFVDPAGLTALDGVYTRFVGSKSSFADVVYEQKKRTVGDLFASELRFLAEKLYLLAQCDRDGRDIRLGGLIDALSEVTACCPVYRTYIRGLDVSRRDRIWLERAFRLAGKRNPGLDGSALEWVRRVLALDFPPDLAEAEKLEWLRFIMQWQQFTGPVMAKGLEDTTLYLYNRLISLNEVGGDPAGIEAPVAAFHDHNCRQLDKWPHTLNATSTHDTKRSEDVRARINVLSEMPAVWETELKRWSRLNAPRKRRVTGAPVPDPNEEIMLYQTLLGAWPLVPAELPAFRQRLRAHVVKAAREAKVNTTWLVSNRVYEEALVHFVDAVLEEGDANEFLRHFVPFQKRIAFYGMLNALAQVLLKVASPGIPDFYQGSELWDFSLVDPDNRRPVDFAVGASALELVKRRYRGSTARGLLGLLTHWEDGLVKLYVTSTALSLRRANADLFKDGDYVPIDACGSKQDNVVAFARRLGCEWVLAVVPRMVVRLVPAGRLPLGVIVWGDDFLQLPDGAPGQWLHLLTGERLEADCDTGALPLSAVFDRFPVALLSGTASDAA